MNQIIVNLLTAVQSHGLSLDILNRTTQLINKQTRKHSRQICILSLATIGTLYTLQNHKKEISALKERLSELESSMEETKENDFREI